MIPHRLYQFVRCVEERQSHSITAQRRATNAQVRLQNLSYLTPRYSSFLSPDYFPDSFIPVHVPTATLEKEKRSDMKSKKHRYKKHY